MDTLSKERMVMTTEDRNYVSQEVKELLPAIFTDSTYSNMVADNIIEDVITDIEESADADFNYSDISLAVQRTILQKMGISVQFGTIIAYITYRT